MKPAAGQLLCCALAFICAWPAHAFSPGSLLPRATFGGGRSGHLSLAARQAWRYTTAPRALSSLRMDADDVEEEVAPITPKARSGTYTVDKKIICIGLSIHTASVSLREKLAIQEDDWASVGREITKIKGITEAAILSTCNRFEIYIVAEDANRGVMDVTDFLHRRSNVAKRELKDNLFVLAEGAAVWHALRVSGGLESLVVGEGQILSQMKRCYEISTSKDGGAGKLLTRMFVTAVTAGKRVRAETGIAKGGVSISSAAVELVEKMCVDDIGLEMNQLEVAIVGAGKMGRLLVQHLTPRNVRKITLINRSKERAMELVDMFPLAPLKVKGMGDMLGCVATHHVTFACTGATEPILTSADLARVIKKPTMLVDISVPRNVDDEGANAIEGCKAYNVDDLKAVVQANQARRKKLMVEAEEVLKEELQSFESWQQSLGSVPMISMLQMRAERIRSEEFRKVESKLQGLSVTEKEAVDRITRGVVNKLLHGPMTQLRQVENADDRMQTARKVAAMFKLEEKMDMMERNNKDGGSKK